MINKKNKQTIGFWDKGKGTTLINCSSEGFDVGLKAEGEDLLAKNFKSINKNKEESFTSWHEMWYIKYIVFPIVVLVIWGIITYIINK